MKRAVDTGLPGVGRPIEWATIADGILYTAQLPIRADGSFETGSIETQTRLTLANLKRTVEAAGATLDDVTQVLVYLPNPQDFAGMNAAYEGWFSRPYPNRAVLVSQLVVPGARIEIVAYAHVGRAAGVASRDKATSRTARPRLARAKAGPKKAKARQARSGRPKTKKR